MSYDKRLPKAWEAINKNKSDILSKMNEFNGYAKGDLTVEKYLKIKDYYDVNNPTANFWLDWGGKGALLTPKSLYIYNIERLYVHTKRVLTSEDFASNTSNAQNTCWWKLPNGLIIQRGYVPVSNGTSTARDITFPIAFTNTSSYTISGSWWAQASYLDLPFQSWNIKSNVATIGRGSTAPANGGWYWMAIGF